MKEKVRKIFFVAGLCGFFAICGGFPLQALAGNIAFSPVQQQEIAKVQAYLNGITTFKADFVQIAPGGQVSTGVARIERPGRMRIEYAPPSRILLIAGQGLFIYYNPELDQTTNLPLSATPLGILLSPGIRLSGGTVQVTRVKRLPGELVLTLIRRADPLQGSLTLIFSYPHLVLRQWQVLDAEHNLTEVTLYNIQTGLTFDQSLFSFVNPQFFQSPTQIP